MNKRNLAIQISRRQSQRQSQVHDRPLSTYRLRQSPLLSIRQNSSRSKSPELSIIQSQLHEIPTCKFCKTDIGLLTKYCMCENVFYHEKCMLDNVRKRSQTIYEGAFICDLGCQQVYNISSHYKKDVTKRGKFCLFLIIILMMIFLSFLISIIILWKQIEAYQKIFSLIILIVLLLVELIVSDRLKTNMYIIYWTLKPIDEKILIKTSLRTLIPFIKCRRDCVQYNYELDEIIEK